MTTRRLTTQILAAVSLIALALACSKQGQAPKPVSTTEPTKPSEPVKPEVDEGAALARVAEVTRPDAAESLTRFDSMKSLQDHLAESRRPHRYAKASPPAYAGAEDEEAAEAAEPPQPAMAPAPNASKKSAEAAGEKDESITNTQEQGVDEGGIVKTHGDHLVVLRRGRLFTVDLGRKSLRPISAISVSPEEGHDAWYDEMLIHEDTIVVVGYSYEADATELGLFKIDSQGKLSHRDTFFLRSNDYYSSRNYASRLLGDKLVFYMPFELGYHLDEENPELPGVMPWNHGKSRFDDWDTIIDATEIYRPIQKSDHSVLHTVVTCDLSRRRVSCSAQGIIGPHGRSFYVSQKAVYVWVHGGYGADSAEGQTPPAAVYRFPLAGGAPGALRLWGAPVDQFSFKESSDQTLNVLVMSSTSGDQMWGSENADEDVALLQVPTLAMTDGVRTVNKYAYVDLPEREGGYGTFHNRFVGDQLLYGYGNGWGHQDRGDGLLYMHSLSRNVSVEVSLPHGVDRIEPMASDAVVVGTDGRNLHFTSLDLHRRGEVADEFIQPRASQGEQRSHGFFFKPSGEQSGTLGLPIRRSQVPGYRHLTEGSAEVLYLKVDQLRFGRLGTLESDPKASQDDQCNVSCVDWYGNARPIFYQGRVFALLGYELVEGQIKQGGIREVDRVNMIDLLGDGRRGVIWKDL